MKVVAFCITLILLTMASVLAVANENTSQLSSNETSDGVRRIKPTELRQALRNGKAVLVDVRSQRAYRGGHIKGAINIPVDEIGNRIDELPKNKLIATYCA